jgi:hypothetical protein
MTIAATSADAAAPQGLGSPRSKPANPRGVPPWLGFLGVAVLPAGGPDESGRRAWVISAGAGTTGMATLVFDTTGQDLTDTTRKEQT